MLSIIIVNYKNPPLLRLCLKTLGQNLAPSFEKEIIVVDSASSAETRNLISEEFPEAKLLPFAENIGYTRGVNEGIKASWGELALILNPDIVILPNSVEKMAGLLERRPDIGLLGPQLLNFDGSPQSSCFRFYSPAIILYRRSFLGRLPFAKKALARFLMNDSDLTKETAVEWLMGSAIMFRKAAQREVGPMDERFFLYMSDVDWAKRFWKAGHKVVYFPEAKMYHYHRRVSKGKFGIFDLLTKKETRWHLKDSVKYFNKHGWR